MTAYRFPQEASFQVPCRTSRRRIGAVALLVGGLVVASSGSVAASEIAGVWMTDDGEGAIEIRPCGEERCGRIAWMKIPKGPDGKIPMDSNNPNPSLRSRPICGLQIITGLKQQSDGTWADGRVYNPDNGQTYGMKIRRDAPDLVKATGYLGFELFGQTRDWRRAPKNLGTCEEASRR